MDGAKCFVCLTKIVDDCDCEPTALDLKSESSKKEKTDYSCLVDIFSKYLQVEFKEKDVQSLELEDKGKQIRLCDCCCTIASESISIVNQLESLEENLKKLLAKIVSCVIESENLQSQSQLVDPLTLHRSSEVDASNSKMHSIQSIRKTLIQNFDAKVKLTSCKPKAIRRIKSKRIRNIGTNIAVSKDSAVVKMEDDPFTLVSVFMDVDLPVFADSSNNFSQPDANSECRKNYYNNWKFEDQLTKRDDHVSTSDTEVEESLKLKKLRKSTRANSKMKRRYRSTSFTKDGAPEARKQNHAKKIGEGRYIYQGFEFRDLENGSGYQCCACPVSCTGSIRNRENIMLHVKRCHINEGKFPCQICGKAFGTGKELRRHGIVHETLRTHMCELCGKTFKMPYQLQLHMKRHESMQSYECHICQKKVTTVYSLQNHIKRVHEGVRDFQCDRCLFKFTSSSSLKRHVRAHDRDSQATQNCNLNLVDRPFQCELCGARLATKYSLNYHMLTVHASSKNFACSVCDKKFKTRKALRRHAVCHSDEYDYMCTICGLRLKRARSLKLHMMTHEGIKRFECEICLAKFAYDQGRKIHIATVHEGQKNYECKTCLKKFGTPQSLARHNLVHTGERKYICETCGNKYQQSNVLKRHIQEVHLKMKPRPRKSYKKMQSDDRNHQEPSGSSSTQLENNFRTGDSESDASGESNQGEEMHSSDTSIIPSKSLFGDMGIEKLESLTPVQFDSSYMSDAMDYNNPIFYDPPEKKLN